MTRHIHKPLPRETYVREGMSYAERIVAETKDALLHGRKVKCICGLEGFVRNHGKGIRWYRAAGRSAPRAEGRK